MTRTLLAAAAAALLVLPACSDSTGSETAARGSMSFQYSGAASGSFNASGSLRRDSNGEMQESEFAAVLRDRQTFEAGVMAYRPRQQGRGDVAALTLGTLTGPRTLTVDGESCGGIPEQSCPGGILMFNVDVNAEEIDDEASIYLLATGTIQVTEVSGGRAKGTFQGTALDLADIFAENPRTIQVTAGTFDVPIVDAEEGDLAFGRRTADGPRAGRAGK